MKRQLMFGTMLSAVLAVGVAAQQPPASGAGPTGASPQTPSDKPAQSMTVTGCLQAASEGAGGAAAGAAAEASPGTQARGGFVLTNVTPAGSMASGSTAPGAKTPGSATGTTGGGATGTAGTTARYRLTGGENLQQYVGQKVEVTGSIAGGSGSGSSSATPAPGAAGSAAGSATSGSSRGQDGQALRVASVRPTGERCSQ